MNVLLAIIILALIGLVTVVVGAPLRAVGSGAGEGEADSGAGSKVEKDELETAREAKYREIRDAELDFRTGKLSREDYDAIDSQLRAEALEILDRLEVEPRDEVRPRDA